MNCYRLLSLKARIYNELSWRYTNCGIRGVLDEKLIVAKYFTTPTNEIRFVYFLILQYLIIFDVQNYLIWHSHKIIYIQCKYFMQKRVELLICLLCIIRQCYEAKLL